MINSFDKFSKDSEMVFIFTHNGLRAYYGQKEQEHYGTFSIITDETIEAKRKYAGYPILVYDWSKYSKKFINGNNTTMNCLYNNFDDMKIGKLNVLRKLVADNVDWIPKTVFTEDAGWQRQGIKFPAICKAANSYDSKGVEKIDKVSDVPDYIDIVQNLIEIDREFRVIAFRGKSNNTIQILQLLEKTPKNNKAKDLRLEESLSKEEMKNKPNTKFEWTILNPSNESKLIPDITKIIKYLFADNLGLNFAGFDIAFDKNGKGWYIEHNILPAPIGPQFLLLYKAMFEDWYNRPICNEMENLLHKLSNEYCIGSSKTVDLKWTNSMPDPLAV